MDGEAGNQDTSQSLAVRRSQRLALTSDTSQQMRLGRVDAPAEVIDTLVEARRAKVHELATFQPPDLQRRFLYLWDVMTFREYRAAVKNVDRWRRELRRCRERGEPYALRDTELTPALFAFLHEYTDHYAASRPSKPDFDPEHHTPTVQGWRHYLEIRSPRFPEEIAKLGGNARFPEDVRQQHTLITAASGQGKSELLKALLHHYVAHESAAVVFIDPHGVTAREIARWPDFIGNDRLVYLDPGLLPGQTFGLNPLHPGGPQGHQIGKLAEQVGLAIGELSSQLTPNMQAVATACARVLIEDGNATLLDLLRLLDDQGDGSGADPDGLRARMLAQGTAHQNEALAWYFRSRLSADSLKGSREGIMNRLFGLLVSDAFMDMTCGRTTVDLPALVNQRKVILINLAPLGPAGRRAMGRLIVALVAGIGFLRDGTEAQAHVPCHLFVDEAQVLATSSFADILFELRKFGVHLTLAQQVEGINFDDAGQKALAESIGIRCASSNRKSSLRAVFDGNDPPEMDGMKKGQFWVRWGPNPPMLLNVRSDFAKIGSDRFPRYAMTEAQWQTVVERQAPYYRPLREAPAEIPPARPPREKKPLL